MANCLSSSEMGTNHSTLPKNFSRATWEAPECSCWSRGSITSGERDAPAKENRARPSFGCRGGASLPHLRLSIAICRGSLPICRSTYQSIRHNFEMLRRAQCQVKNNQDRWRVLHTSSTSRPLYIPATGISDCSAPTLSGQAAAAPLRSSGIRAAARVPL